jgi:calcineurin-like phosphoesterase
VQRDQAIRRFLTQTHVKLESASADPWLNGVLIEAGDDGRARSIEQLLVPADG